MSNDRKELVDWVRGIYQNLNDAEKRDAIRFFPELRESEDERIRKEIEQSAKEYYKENYAGDNPQGRNVVIQSYIDGALAYLERQKEQKPYCLSNDVHEDAAREFRGKCLPPIEPISDELIDIIKGEFEGFRNLLKKKGIDYEPRRGYWEGFARLFDSSAREYVKEQKPAWSEEDESILNNIIAYRYLNVDDLEWIKKLPERFNLQPKQEWSEEDKQNLDNIIWLCENCEKGIENVWIPSQAKEIKRLIKSLRPGWKPSEEQMKVLKEAVAYFGDSWISQKQKILESLYNDLLKQK